MTASESKKCCKIEVWLGIKKNTSVHYWSRCNFLKQGISVEETIGLSPLANEKKNFFSAQMPIFHA
jgi:hypothetical protein